MPNLIIKKAEEKDIPQIVTLVESVYRGDSSKQGWTTEADLLDGQRTDAEMIRDLLKSDGVFLLAWRGDRLLASVSLEKKNDYAYLGMLAVDTQVQNQKLGQKMLKESEKWISEMWGLQEIRITVLEQRLELIAWYQRQGYEATGDYAAFPSDIRYGIPKVSNLCLKEFRKKIIYEK